MLARLLPLLATASLLGGCGSADPPQVMFAAGPGNVIARPTQYCNVEFTDCRNDAAAPVELAVPPGTPLQITVPAEIAQTPWQVVYTYRDAAGAPVDERSPVFPPAQRSIYTLELPAPTDRLLTLQVQQYGPPPQANVETGEIEFPIRASWVFTVAA